jgi:hypothetical protein
MSPPAFWYLLYVKGLFESLRSNQFFLNMLQDAVNNPSQLIGKDFFRSKELIQLVANGSFVESLLNGKWEFLPDRSHPRGLRGCDFLTSLEFKALLNVDLCRSDTFSSIKFLCPESCGCRPSVFSNSDRDLYFNGNFSDESSSWILGDGQQAAPLRFVFSNDRVGMSECPASCVVPHHDLPGQSRGWDDFEAIAKSFFDHYYTDATPAPS